MSSRLGEASWQNWTRFTFIYSSGGAHNTPWQTVAIGNESTYVHKKDRRTSSNVTYWCFPCDYNCEANVHVHVLFTGVVRSDLSARSSSDWCLSETQQTLLIAFRWSLTFFAEADQSLFRRILNNEFHVLHQLLPEKTNCTYNLRSRQRDRQLTRKSTHINDSLFFIRMSYKDAYWRFTCILFVISQS